VTQSAQVQSQFKPEFTQSDYSNFYFFSVILYLHIIPKEDHLRAADSAVHSASY